MGNILIILKLKIEDSGKYLATYVLFISQLQINPILHELSRTFQKKICWLNIA